MTSSERLADARLPPRERVKSRGEFRRAQARGARVHTPHFVVLVHPNETGLARVGVTVTKKTAPRAVDRNRVKRLVREAFRRAKATMPSGFDLIFIAKTGPEELTLSGVQGELAVAERAIHAATRRAVRR